MIYLGIFLRGGRKIQVCPRAPDTLATPLILVKVVLRESILETAILQNSNDFIEFVCSDIELNCFKYGHMKMCHMKS